jgi:hypothetical protein
LELLEIFAHISGGRKAGKKFSLAEKDFFIVGGPEMLMV